MQGPIHIVGTGEHGAVLGAFFAQDAGEAPRVYARDGDDYLLVASNGGADRPPAWLHNLAANPGVEIQIARERRNATARIVEASDPDYDRLWKIVNENNRDRYSAYQRQTTRPIPVIAVTPT